MSEVIEVLVDLLVEVLIDLLRLTLISLNTISN